MTREELEKEANEYALKQQDVQSERNPPDTGSLG